MLMISKCPEFAIWLIFPMLFLKFHDDTVPIYPSMSLSNYLCFYVCFSELLLYSVSWHRLRPWLKKDTFCWLNPSMLSTEQKTNKLNAIPRKRDFQMIVGVWGGGGVWYCYKTKQNWQIMNVHPCLRHCCFTCSILLSPECTSLLAALLLHL